MPNNTARAGALEDQFAPDVRYLLRGTKTREGIPRCQTPADIAVRLRNVSGTPRTQEGRSIERRGFASLLSGQSSRKASSAAPSRDTVKIDGRAAHFYLALAAAAFAIDPLAVRLDDPNRAAPATSAAMTATSTTNFIRHLPGFMAILIMRGVPRQLAKAGEV